MSTHELSRVLERIRDINIRSLKAASEEHAPCYMEPALRNEDGTVAGEGEFDLPCRVDVIPIGDDDDLLPSVMVDPSTRLRFQTLLITEDGMRVSVKPFGWDHAEFVVRFPGKPVVQALLQWFLTWFDPDDNNAVDPDGLSGVVHYLSDPAYSKDKLRFDVDFGSAPVEAFHALVQTLKQMGASAMEVG